MDWSKLYKAPQKANWKGRSDGPGAERYHDIIEMIDLRQGIPSVKNKPTFGLIGFASDLGIERNKGRIGAALGPQALRNSLAKLPAPDPQKFTLYDLGDIVCENDLEQAQASLSIIIAMILAQGIKPIVLGGGHEVAWANYQGIATFNPKLDLSIINFDAHYDLRPLEEGLGNSGTSFRQMYESTQKRNLTFDYTVIGLQPQSNTRALHAFAESLKVKTVLADKIEDFKIPKSAIYLTVCLDVFAAPFAPGVSAPQPLGLIPSKIIPLFRQLSKSALSFDIAELSPPYDIDNRTSSLGASLVSIFIYSNLN